MQGKTYRITVLTPWLLRLEYNENGIFEDRPTQCVWNRSFPVPSFRYRRKNICCGSRRKGFSSPMTGKRFSANGLSIKSGEISAPTTVSGGTERNFTICGGLRGRWMRRTAPYRLGMA